MARSAAARASALLVRVGARALLGARLARGRRRDLDRVRGDAAAARALGESLELVGRFVDRLEVALMLMLAALRRDVRMPALGEPAAGELDVALVKRRLQLQQEERLFEIKNLGH